MEHLGAVDALPNTVYTPGRCCVVNQNRLSGLKTCLSTTEPISRAILRYFVCDSLNNSLLKKCLNNTKNSLMKSHCSNQHFIFIYNIPLHHFRQFSLQIHTICCHCTRTTSNYPKLRLSNSLLWRKHSMTSIL